MNLEHFGYPCHNPKETPFTPCPRCGMAIYEGDEVYTDQFKGYIIGCESCISISTHELEEEDE